MLPAVIVIVWWYQRLSAPAVARARELRSEINAQTAESIAGMAVLRATGATRAFTERYERTIWRQYEARREELRANAWLLRPALDFLNLALLAAVIAVFGLSAQGPGALGTVEIGVLYAFVSYIARVVDPLIQITNQFSQLQQSVVAAARVNVLMREAQAGPSAAQGQVRAGAVSVRGLSFAYLPGRMVLHDIDLQVAPGSFCGLVGHTGSGKSTLIALLLRFYPVRHGHLEIDGLPLDALDDTAFRQAVALVPQEPFLIAASVRENIDMGRGLSAAAIEAASRDAHAHAFIERFDKGYDTLLGEGGAGLAVGQKQLIAIARALAGQPRILLLDEATAHIDTETEIEVQKALTALRGRITVIAIAHRLSTIREADQIVVLSHGRVVERGSHAALMGIEGGTYQRLVELQGMEGGVG